MFGLFNVNKPCDVTSREIVNHVQRLVRPSKVGHAGTLDPLATGVLVVCVGQATRLNELIQRFPKRYVGTFLLGRQSDTEDTEGEVVSLSNPPQPCEAEVEQVLHQFRGETWQHPPAFSALKVKGKRAYALARRGQKVELEPRQVTIHEIGLVRYAYPELVLDITCNSGTYIRSLGRDIGVALGSAAVMSALQRTAIGPFKVEEACTPRELSAATLGALLIPAIRAVEQLPQREVSAEELEDLSHGRFIPGVLPEGSDLIAAVDGVGNLVALLSSAPEGELKPHRFFSPEPRGSQYR